MTTDQSSDTQEFDRFLEQLGKTPLLEAESTPGSVRAIRSFYAKRVSANRTGFRVSGSISLLLSTSLPFLSAFAGPIDLSGAVAVSKDMLVSGVAVVLALSLGMNSFFGWSSTWRAYTEAIVALDRLWNAWCYAVAEARWRAQTEPSAAIEDLRTAYRLLQEGVHAVNEREMQDYFQRAQLPETPKS
jgi:hypothetical protein